jgi:hypothetical protein
MSIAFKLISGEWQNWQPESVVGEELETIKQEHRLLWGRPEEDRRKKNGIGFRGGIPPIFTIDVGARFVFGRLRYFFNQRMATGPDDVELAFSFELVRDEETYETVLKMLHTQQLKTASLYFEDSFPIDIELENEVVIRLLGFAEEPKPNDAPLFHALDAVFGDTTTVYLIARLEKDGPDPPEPTRETAVFDMDKCPVPAVLPIEQIPIIWNCEISDPPEPIVDCPEIAIDGVSLPPPVRELIPFMLLERVETLDDFPKQAERTDTGATITVRPDPELVRRFGPAEIGFTGWAYPLTAGDICGGEDDEWRIVEMQHFARHVRFGGLEDCTGSASLDGFWNGEEPTWDIFYDASHLAPNCDCLGDGIATLNEKRSQFPILHYDVVDVYRMPSLKVDTAECEQNGSGTGQTINELYFSKPPFEIDLGDGECPKTATVRLVKDLIDASGSGCLDLSADYEECRYVISGSVVVKLVGGKCITVQTNDCGGTINLNYTPQAGECIAIDGATSCSPTFRNTFDLVDGKCTTIGGSRCRRSVDVNLQGSTGACFDVSVDSNCGVTVTDKLNFQNGTCIKATRSGCNIRHDFVPGGGQLFNALCDIELTPLEIECYVDPSTDEWGIRVVKGSLTLTKKFASFLLPACIGTVYSDCSESEPAPAGAGVEFNGLVES